MRDCLHCEINDLVTQYIEEASRSGTAVQIGEIMSMMVESLVDLILQQEESQQANLLAAAVGALGDLFLQKSGPEGDSTATH